MKKILAATAIGACALTLAGCSVNVSVNTTTAPETETVQSASATTSAQGSSEAQTTASGATTVATETSEFIQESEAKNIAMQHAGVSEQDITFMFAETDYENGRQCYEIKFTKGLSVYEYKIDAKTGDILEFDKEGI